MPPDWSDCFPAGQTRDPWLSPGAFRAYMASRHRAARLWELGGRLSVGYGLSWRLRYDRYTRETLDDYLQDAAAVERYDAEYLYHLGAGADA